MPKINSNELHTKFPKDFGFEGPCEAFFEKLAKEYPCELFGWCYDDTLSIGMRSIAIEACGLISEDYFEKEERINGLLRFSEAMLFEAAIYAAEKNLVSRNNYRKSIEKLKNACQILVECCDDYLEGWEEEK